VSEDLDIYDAIAVALAHAREPDLSPFDPGHIRSAMERALTHDDPRRDFLGWLHARVQLLSDGRVSVEERPSENPAALGCAPSHDVPEVPVRLVVEGEPFAEPAVLRAQEQAVHFPMRS
jgi:hypothetical protein